MRISDWSSDVCSSDLQAGNGDVVTAEGAIDVGVDGIAHVELRLRSGSASVKARDTKDKQSESMMLTINRLDLYAGCDFAQLEVTAQTADTRNWPSGWRSDEHTSELQSLMRISYAICELKNKNIH